MRHGHLRSQRWAYEAVRLEHVLDDPEDAAHQQRQDPTSFEGGVDSAVYSLWRAYLRDARAWAVEHRR